MNNLLMSQTIANIAKALVKAQREMSNAVKDSKNPFFRSSYADLNSVREACLPALLASDISVTQPIVQKDGKNYVRTLFIHSSGEYYGSDTEIVVAKQNDPQAYGSGISYARRYGLQSLAFLSAVDDDGETAMGRPTQQKQQSSTVKVELQTANQQTQPVPSTTVNTTESQQPATETASSNVTQLNTSEEKQQKRGFRKPAKQTSVEGWE